MMDGITRRNTMKALLGATAAARTSASGDEALERRNYSAALEAQRGELRVDPQVRRFRESRVGLAADPYRPLYHFSVPENTLNDPNGLCQWRGRYHMFYQFVPKGRDRIHWGHTVSEDLIRWEDLPAALYPEAEKHVFSGQALVEANRVVAIYHGVAQGNSIATASDPLLLNWRKHPGNPVIPIVETDANGYPYRVFDPCIWKEDDGYYALSGTYKDGRKHGGPISEKGHCRNVFQLFRSKDLAEWEYLGPLYEDGFHTEPGEDGAVPNFLPISAGRHMLLFFSHKRASQYYVGTYDRTAHRFSPDFHGRINHGPVVIGSLHAPSATVDGKGRYIGVFNMKEARWRSSWTGMMALPRHFALDGASAISIQPVAEVESLRFGQMRVDAREMPANQDVVLDGIRGQSMEIEAVIEPREAREVGLNVFRSADGTEATRISFYRDASFRYKDVHLLQIDVSRSSLRADVRARTPETGPLGLAKNEALRLRVFIDRSIVEVFANGRQCLSLRAYPERAGSTGVSLFAYGSAARLVSLNAWHMRSIWPELKFKEGK